MGYQVLARKWRPQTFEQVVGQTHVLKALANGLKHGRIHHAYLFSGTRGVGKTSIARLLAKGLNCELGVTDTPCGTCQNCVEIEKGRFVDLLEIDAASRTKVEDTRELLDNIQYAPVKGRFKVYLIDEVHMLSKHSFNALLKTLEEPPEHVKFLLATTDPQKLPITILSRCLQFNLRAMDIPQITEQLSHILTAEKIPFDAKALQLLARAADGSMRDALSLTDQAIASGENQVLTDVVTSMLGMLDDDQPIAIVDALIRGNTLALFDELRQISEKGGSFRETLLEVTSILHQIALIQLIPSALESHYAHHEMKLKDLARIVSPTDLQIFYQIMILGQKELPYAPDPKMGVEMTLLRALAFHPHKVTKSELPPPTVLEPTVATPASQSSPAAKSPYVSPATPATSTGPTATPKNIQHSTPLPPQIDYSQERSIQAQESTQQTALPQAPIASALEGVNQNEAPAKSTLSPTEHLLRAREKIKQAHLKGADEKKSPKTESTAQSLNHEARHPIELTQLDQNPKHFDESIESKDTQTSLKAPSLRAGLSIQDTELTLDEKITLHQKLINDIKEHEEEHGGLDEYQWTSQQIDEDEQIISLKEIKNSFETDKTPEVQKRLIEAAQQRDNWAKIIGQLALPKLVEQLLLNSYFDKQANLVTIAYRTSHQHLAHNGAKQKIQDALMHYFQESIEISFIVSDDMSHLTPHEIRQEIYNSMLLEAKASIYQDNQLKLLCDFFDATIEEESIRPLA